MGNRTHLDLFSGIGGFALAAQSAGWTTIGFSEIEPYACKILKRHWPEVPNHGDIRTMRGIRADLVTGGFPCQPFSCAGKRRGAEDDRALWPEMRRVIAESGASWVLAENVPGIIGMELDNVLSDLEGLGYTTGTLVIPACAVDARHRRDRVWIVAHSDSGRLGESGVCTQQPERTEAIGASEDVANASINGRDTRREGDPKKVEGGRQSGRSGEQSNNVANTTGRRQQGQRKPVERGNSAESGKRKANHAIPVCIGNQWQPEPELGRVAHGIPNRSHRLKGLGNAIVPQVAETLLRMIASVDESYAQ